VTQRQIENDRIGRMARSSNDALPFLCECGLAGCFELVWLSTAELAACRDANRLVLAHAAEPAQLAAA